MSDLLAAPEASMATPVMPDRRGMGRPAATGSIQVVAQLLPTGKEPVMATVAEQFWREVLEIRRPLEPLERHRPRPERLVLVRGGRIRRERKPLR
jgi:hypothetical protein